MVKGIIIGVVKNNRDPEGLHRVLVEYPISSAEDSVESTWARICSPMAGVNRGLVLLPDIGTEVALCFSYRSLTPYVLGGVYNGKKDKPEPYHNDDGENNLRVFWSRNDSMVVFDDTKGAEKVQMGVKAGKRLDAESGIIWQTLDAPNETYSEYCGGDTCWTAMKTVSLKCTNFELTTTRSCNMKAGGKIDRLAGGNMNFNAAALVNFMGSQVLRNSGVSADPREPISSGLGSSTDQAVGALKSTRAENQHKL